MDARAVRGIFNLISEDPSITGSSFIWLERDSADLPDMMCVFVRCPRTCNQNLAADIFLEGNTIRLEETDNP